MEKRKNIHVLIVDDEDRFRETTSIILRRRGFDVTAVGNGAEAVGKVGEGGIDVVILDLRMPGMDGHETLREIRKLPGEVEVIMLTGHGTPESAARGLVGGVFDYLSKPCNIDLLASKIHEAVQTKRRLPETERRVKDIMVPLSSFSTIGRHRTAADAVDIIRQSFTRSMTTATLQETVHRSILVLDEDGSVIGVVSFSDLLRGLQPPYMRLLEERPARADSIHLEPPGWSGLFTVMVRDLKNISVRELMSGPPPTIAADANLMEAANSLLALNVRRLLVVEDGSVTGVIREQDLFFCISTILEQMEDEERASLP
ncbi:MAG: response regulator [Pseudomonadota bacterium]